MLLPKSNQQLLRHPQKPIGDGTSLLRHRRRIVSPMRFKPFPSLPRLTTPDRNSHLNPYPFMATQTHHLLSQTLPTDGENSNDDFLCSSEVTNSPSESPVAPLSPSIGYLTGEARIERAWAHWNSLGRPKLIVAPMVDNSELPFRLLCRKYGAEAAYTPMLHSRMFTENEKYRSQEFTTCKVLFSLTCC